MMMLSDDIVDIIYSKRFREKLNGYLWKNYRKSANQDIFQEAAERAFRYREDFQGSSTLETWVFRIAINVAFTTWLKEKHLRKIDSLDPHEECDNLLCEDDLFGQLVAERKLINLNSNHEGLSDSYNNLFYNRYIKGMKYEALAKKYKVPLGTIRSRIHNMKKQMEVID